MANKIQSVAVERYKQKTYDRMDIRIPKGRKKELEIFLKEKNLSINQFLNAFIMDLLQITDTEWKTGILAENNEIK